MPSLVNKPIADPYGRCYDPMAPRPLLMVVVVERGRFPSYPCPFP